MTAVTEGTAVARGVYWSDAYGRTVLRVLSVDGEYVNPDNPRLAEPIRTAAAEALDRAGRLADADNIGLVRADAGWHPLAPHDASHGWPSAPGGDLLVELTADELESVAHGRMPAALRVRVKRAFEVDPPLDRPTAYTGELPKQCRVSTRGRRGATSATPRTVRAVKRVAAVLRPNGVEYHPRIMEGRTDLDLIRAAHADGLSCLMFGAPGTGKTAALEAALLDFEYVPGTADTVADDFVGAFVPEPGGSFRWVDGPLLRAMERGVPLIIDEVALIDPRILAIVYAPMDGRGELPVVQNLLRGTVKAQPGFGVHGACNPDAPGAMMSEALISRFAVQVEYGTDYALAEQLGCPADVVQAARNLEAKRLTGETTYAPQMRELLAFVRVARLFDSKTALGNLVAAAPAQDRPLVADVLSRAIGDEINTLRIGE